jgi:hypothetical protein
MKKRIEVGKRGGRQYWLHHDLVSAQFPHITTKEWGWHLWVDDRDDGYIGYFQNKNSAMTAMASHIAAA